MIKKNILWIIGAVSVILIFIPVLFYIIKFSLVHDKNINH